jgi:hypothetical protein
LHHIIDITLFAVLFNLVCSLACFWPADYRVESELPNNFQDINFEDLEQQPAGFIVVVPASDPKDLFMERVTM